MDLKDIFVVIISFGIISLYVLTFRAIFVSCSRAGRIEKDVKAIRALLERP